jgi:hypothetical protein
MSHEHPSGRIVHEVVWSDAFPWWILLTAAGNAFAPTVLLLALLGSTGVWAGWSIADRVGLPGQVTELMPPPPGESRGAAQPPHAPGLEMPRPPRELPPGPSLRAMPAWRAWLGRLPRPVQEVLVLATAPVSPGGTLAGMAGSLVRLAWLVLVWSVFGTAIARHAALKLVGEEPPVFAAAVGFGSRKWPASFNAAAFVVVGMLALAIPGAILGLVMRADWGLAVAGVVWPLVLLGAVVLAILAIGLVLGWPLMVATVGVERGDSFQAISTSFSYVYQRPLYYAFYAAVGSVLALVAFGAAAALADATQALAFWAASFGMGHERTRAVLEGMTQPGGGPWGMTALRFWADGLTSLLAAFGCGYFWSVVTAIYLLLRRDVDATELDELVLDEPMGA